MPRRIEATNLGTDAGYPFVMVFAFAKSGTVVLTGSINRIENYAKDRLEPCHAMVHTYLIDRIIKAWKILGNTMLEVDNLRQLQKRRTHLNFMGVTRHSHRECYVIYHPKTGKVYGAWRRLPSCFLRELDGYVETHFQSSPNRRLGGLDPSGLMI